MAEPDAPTVGGAKDAVQSTPLNEALPDITDPVINAPNTTAPASSATGAATDAVEQAQGAGAASGVGESIEGSVSFNQQLGQVLDDSVIDLPPIKASVIAGRQTYLPINKEALFTALITGSVSSWAAINWGAEFAVDSAIKNNRILAEELNDIGIPYYNNVRGYQQLQRQIMYGMGSVISLPITATGGAALGRGGTFVAQAVSKRIGLIGPIARLEIAAATIDGVSIAAGGVGRQAVKEAFIISTRREVAREIVQQGVKHGAIENIIKTTTKALIK